MFYNHIYAKKEDFIFILCFNMSMEPKWLAALNEEIKGSATAEPIQPIVKLSEIEKAIAYYRNVLEYTLEIAYGHEENLDRAVEELTKAKEENERKDATIQHLKLTIAKLQRERFGARSERSYLPQDQLELQLEELEATATEDDLAAEQDVVPETTKVVAFERKKPSRKPFPEHLPRERVVVPSPTSCECCGGTHLVKLGEDVTETLEMVPRTWKVIQHVREKFSCRDCQHIGQPPAPFHVTPRGWADPNLLATILFEKFGQHQPLNRQAERYAREGVDLSLSTLADHVGTCCSVLHPLFGRLEAHVLAAERLHGDDTTVPILAKGKTTTGRLWTYVRDDQPSGGPAPPAAVFYYSPDRKGEHPQAHLAAYRGILQADAYGGYGKLYEGGGIVEAGCWAHARRKFYELADVCVGKDLAYIQPMAIAAVRRIDAVMAIEPYNS